MTVGAWLVIALNLAGPAPPTAAPWVQSAWPGFPSAALAGAVGDCPVTFHGQEDWRRATFLDWALPGDPLPVPRLILSLELLGPARDIGAVLDSYPVDTAEHLLAALLEAALDGPVLRDQVVQRAASLAVAEGLDWAGDDVLRSFSTALADFGAHVLSLAFEVRRVSGRIRDRGSDPCPLALQRTLIFGLWRKAMEEPSIRLMQGGRVPGPFLPESERDWLLREVLGLDWSGWPDLDLDLDCRQGRDVPRSVAGDGR